MKIFKMTAIALMALSLFSCKKDEPKNEAAALNIRINDAELRALESEIADGAETTIMSNVVLTLKPSGRTITLSDTQIAEAKTAEGTRIDAREVVNAVSMTANLSLTDESVITSFQGMADKFTTDIPLSAPETNTTSRDEDGNTIYSVTLNPTPAFARLEVSGVIEPQANDAGLNAFEDIKVTAVYMNNYLNTRAADARTFVAGNGENGFAGTIAPEMMDEITDDAQADFEARSKVAGYQLFPIKVGELPGNELYDHVILKLHITYSATAQANKYPAEADRYVTIVKFMKEATGDLPSFLAGTIYKLDLAELSKDFKTDDNGNPDPDNPDTPDPEPTGKKILEVKVEPYTWTAVNIKPDVEGNGYKK